ncbi:nucleotide-sugar transporter [Stylonychia lemnae]|uniref:Nucleotide-sugar transporter n=1 Tax=Stylonychia lemnae TaxID=5949 RepID=A0A078A284_STYLE|nr:nucleotide-sugar transporter [Stylonychia lemnae]|eukprot:CDW74879.1 nucleotide-sugar transporter [Stylonychia lemnae]
MSNQEKIVGLRLYMIMLAMLLTGTANTILMKMQNLTIVGGDNFNHPFVQCAIMFVGEFLCLGIYGIKILFMKYQASQKSGSIEPQSPGTKAANIIHLKTNINPLWLAIPAAFDIIASTLMNIALTMVAASVYQMLRGMIIIVTAAMSIIFLKRKLYRHHWSSIGCIFFGVFLVGLAAVLSSGSDGQSTNVWGLLILIIAQLFAGGLFIVEEKLLGDYYLDPLKVVGLEGMWGMIFYAILLPIFQQIKCSGQLCPYGVLEDTTRAFQDFGDDHVLIILSVGICCSIAGFNSFGVAVTKNASAAQRSTIDTSRTVLIWIFFLAIPIYGTYQEHFKWLQLVGFIFLVFGTLVYNEILVLPVLGFDQYTREALAKKSHANTDNKGLLDLNNNSDNTPSTNDMDYAATSPHAAYDANRLKRNIQNHMEDLINKTGGGDEVNMSIEEKNEKNVF